MLPEVLRCMVICPLSGFADLATQCWPVGGNGMRTAVLPMDDAAPAVASLAHSCTSVYKSTVCVGIASLRNAVYRVSIAVLMMLCTGSGQPCGFGNCHCLCEGGRLALWGSVCVIVRLFGRVLPSNALAAAMHATSSCKQAGCR